MPAAFSPEDVAIVRPGVNIVSLPLTAEEGFVLSRVDGQSSVRDLSLATGLPESRVHAALDRLVSLQAIQVGKSGPAGPASVVTVAAAPASGELTAAEQAEEVDLTPEQRQRIKTVAFRAGVVSHYELLELERRASAGEIKRAFLERSREFHPDSYFRKRLGTFKPMMEKAFRGLKTAYDVLGDAEARKKYDETVRTEADETELRRLADLRAWKLDPRRQQEAEDRRKKRNPMFQRIEKAQRHYKLAQDERSAKRYQNALNEIALAIAHDPSDPAIRQLNDEIHADIRAEKAAKVVALAEAVALRGVVLEGASLLELAKQAMELESLNAVVYLRLGKLLMDSEALQPAREACERALKLDGENVKALDLMVDIYERAGMGLNAARALEKLIKIKSTPERVERLKRLRGTP